jgi:hypothetical protein
MSRAFYRVLVLLGVGLVLAWPILLGGVIGGQQGLCTVLASYLAVGGLLLGIFALAACRREAVGTD